MRTFRQYIPLAYGATWAFAAPNQAAATRRVATLNITFQEKDSGVCKGKWDAKSQRDSGNEREGRACR